MPQVHPLLEGVDEICSRYRLLDDREGLFEAIYERIRANWRRDRQADRWPTPSNWVLRVAPEYTQDAERRLEKQLQKQIAICLEKEQWGNDLPTASGLFDARGRQINIDLCHRIPNGFEFVELKLESNTTYEAATQILRYGAIYMLYRLEPELVRHFRNEMVTAKQIVLEVLAPYRYYSWTDIDLPLLEHQFDRQVAAFAARREAGIRMSFRFMAFSPRFIYQPGMDCESIREAVRGRASPFSFESEFDEHSSLRTGLRSEVEITGHGGQRIRSFEDWETFALPPDRKALHWKEGRSAYELARIWTERGAPAVPAELTQLLESQEGTRRTVIEDGITEHQTRLPFGNGGPRCHDLALRAQRDDCTTTICIEAKADEPFGRTVAEELRAARQRPVTQFPQRLDWLTRSLLGLPALSEEVSWIPYQLLTAVAGTLIEAQQQKATSAILVIHEFRTMATDDARMAANGAALDRFLRMFYSANGGPDEDLQLSAGELIGPISMVEREVACPTKLPCEIPLFIGKLRTDRRG